MFLSQKWTKSYISLFFSLVSVFVVSFMVSSFIRFDPVLKSIKANPLFHSSLLRIWMCSASVSLYKWDEDLDWSSEILQRELHRSGHRWQHERHERAEQECEWWRCSVCLDWAAEDGSWWMALVFRWTCALSELETWTTRWQRWMCCNV